MSSIIQDDQVFNNEVSFCRVYSRESKKTLEERFLSNRISYYIDWHEQSFLKKLFGGNKNKIYCTIRINRADVERARELVSGLEDIKLRDFGEHRKDKNGKKKK
ncbi:hypothetical protein [Butyrivibrio sp. WCD3002]|uniref:hypothetical protein n=1 Tax=Butyrivibrio sp. WCD3002 TaxID=1280676 RepID=UPI0003FF688A|nr:hypothetical protein [Butyrivibrio sp. WCD3002]